jgi:hypothetical protein
MTSKKRFTPPETSSLKILMIPFIRDRNVSIGRSTVVSSGFGAASGVLFGYNNKNIVYYKN